MRILFLFILLGCCLCVSNVWAQKEPVNMDLQKEKGAAGELLNSGITIRSIFSAEGEIKQGGLLLQWGYEFSDGIKIKKSEADYKTAKRARERFREIVRIALKVLERNETHSKKAAL